MNKNQAFCAILDDTQVEGFRVLLKSLLIHNPWFDLDFIIFDFGALSAHNREILDSSYSKIKIRNINRHDYRKCFFKGGSREWSKEEIIKKTTLDANTNIYNAAYRFEIFTLSEYDTVIYMDADMLVLDDISSLVRDVDGHDFAACLLEHPKNPFTHKLPGYNGGLLKISKRYLNNVTKNELINMCEDPYRSLNYSGNQALLNDYFFDKPGSGIIDFCYNTQTEQIINYNILEEAKIIHFVGSKKPWSPIQKVDHLQPVNMVFNFFGEYQIRMIGAYMCLSLMSQWRKYYDMCINEDERVV